MALRSIIMSRVRDAAGLSRVTIKRGFGGYGISVGSHITGDLRACAGEVVA